jgi:hypothetical protein
MKMRKLHTNHRIEAREALALRDGRGSTITCISGTIWLTMEGDTRDVVLKAGESFVVDRRGLAILAAHESSVVDVCAPHRARRWWSNVVDFLDQAYGPSAIRASWNRVY